MARIHETKVSPMRLRNNLIASEPVTKNRCEAEWKTPVARRPGELFLRNIAVASALVLCAVTLRTGTLPPLKNAADVVLTAASDHSLLDEQLGKLSFVSSIFPEAVLVFGERNTGGLSLSVRAEDVVHTWSEAEPYISCHTEHVNVTSALDGEVIGVYHGNGDERLVQVMGYDGIACMYGNLEEVIVQTGDSVSVGDVLGKLHQGAEYVLEVRRDGKSIDPTLYISR